MMFVDYQIIEQRLIEDLRGECTTKEDNDRLLYLYHLHEITSCAPSGLEYCDDFEVSMTVLHRHVVILILELLRSYM